MTSVRIFSRPLCSRPLWFVLAAPVAALLAVVALFAAAPHAAASNALRPGLGYRAAGGDFVGYYRAADGTQMYCIDPRKAAPQSVSLHTVSRVHGLSGLQIHQLSYALAHWGHARTAAQAATESQVLNTLAGNTADVSRRERTLPGSLRPTVAAHVREARLYAGSYSVRVTMTALTPGSTGTGSVVVTSAGGHRVPGVQVRLAATGNASVPATVHTGGAGSARFTYRVTGVGEVRVSAVATGLAAPDLRASSPPSGVQRMISPAGAVTARGAAAFRKALGGFAHSYACTTTCDGHPAAQLSACAPASTLASRIEYRLGSSLLAWTFAPSRMRTCHTLAATLADGERVTAAWRYRTAKGWSAAVPAAGGFVVDCPPAPAVTITMSYSCQAVTLRAALSDDTGGVAPASGWVNPTKHAMVLVIGGDEPRRIVARPGQAAQFTATRTCADPSTFTVQAGVQRAGGGWNYGRVATVRTPGNGG